jgi:RecA-family ATPase
MLPVARAWELPVCPPERRWLIEDLWADQAVGIIGGEPKCGKSFLALDLLVAVASGVPCLRRFAARQRGSVLL